MKKPNIDEIYMVEALRQAQRACEEDEVPIGAVIVHEGRVIARGYNQVERLHDATAHAEMLALTSASNLLQTKWLNQAQMYVTIEPCAMCAGALVLARIKRVIYGAADPKCGGCGSVVNVIANVKLNHRIVVTSGILQDACGAMMSEFFKKKRKVRN
jgi:tRNA(adenine34) deaminase